MTVDQLLDRANAALAAAGVRVPDGSGACACMDTRSFRYYRSQGLVDPPTRKEGVAGVYGPRHLGQLLAIKALQARYLPLAEIRKRLADASDEELGAISEREAEEAAPPPPRQRNAYDQAPQHWVEFRLSGGAYAMVSPAFLGAARPSALRALGEQLTARLLAERERVRA